MADKIEHLMLEQFRRLDHKLERMSGEICELKIAFVSMTHHKRWIEWAQNAHGEAIEGLRRRVERVERRLELSEPDPTSPTGLSDNGTPYQPPPKRR